MIDMTDEFELGSLQASCVDFFRRWDDAVAAGDSAAARHARRDLLAHTRARLSTKAAGGGGIYLFCASNSAAFISDLVYIGITKGSGRPIARRIEDRLRDDNCFDAGLDGLEDAEAAEKVRRRLRVAMPRSNKDYTADHLRTRELVRRSQRIIILRTSATSGCIAEAEKLLIGSAHHLGAPLTNKQHLRFRGAVTPEGLALADAVVTSLSQRSWNEGALREWAGEVRRRAGLPTQ